MSNAEYDMLDRNEQLKINLKLDFEKNVLRRKMEYEMERMKAIRNTASYLNLLCMLAIITGIQLYFYMEHKHFLTFALCIIPVVGFILDCFAMFIETPRNGYKRTRDIKRYIESKVDCNTDYEVLSRLKTRKLTALTDDLEYINNTNQILVNYVITDLIAEGIIMFITLCLL